MSVARFVVVCEAGADRRTATGLADRLFVERGAVARDALDRTREYCGIEAHRDFLRWGSVRELAAAAGIKAHGHFDGGPGAPDALAGRRALRLIQRARPDAAGVFLIRDDDRHPDRRAGLDQARSESAMRERVVIGVAHPNREAWALAGFDPKDAAEKNRLGRATEELGFAPNEQPGRLGGAAAGDRSAKRVLAVLTGGDEEREAQCWEKTESSLLRQRGPDCGLAAYLDEVETKFVPRVRRAT